jgi:hypothetical protein
MFDNYQAIAADAWGDSWWNSMNTKAPPKDKAKARAWASFRGSRGIDASALSSARYIPSDPTVERPAAFQENDLTE